jgi:hypothetical protein
MPIYPQLRKCKSVTNHVKRVRYVDRLIKFDILSDELNTLFKGIFFNNN